MKQSESMVINPDHIYKEKKDVKRQSKVVDDRKMERSNTRYTYYDGILPEQGDGQTVTGLMK